MKRLEWKMWAVSSLCLVFLLAACSKEPSTQSKPPPQQTIPKDAISYFGRMIIINHNGPKAHLFLKNQKDPLWFSTVRDLFSYRLMPEENQTITALYVHDMGEATTWDHPGPHWIEAEKAVYVINSRKLGGMGGKEVVPFKNQTSAETFIKKYGGRWVDFMSVPASYVHHGEDSATTVPHSAHH